MIGLFEEAEAIAEWEYNRDSVPPGFSYVDEGAQRIVIMGQSGILYKKETEEPDSNYMEYENYQKLSRRPIAGWRIPETHLYVINGNQPVIAMEFIEGKKDRGCNRYAFGYIDYRGYCTCKLNPCSAFEWEKPQSLWGITDLSVDNILVEESTGLRVLIDMVF